MTPLPFIDPARITRAVEPQSWLPCQSCNGLGYAPFDPWNHANDVPCISCRGRGGEHIGRVK